MGIVPSDTDPQRYVTIGTVPCLRQTATRLFVARRDVVTCTTAAFRLHVRRHDALSALLRSFEHSTLDWAAEVLPALRAGDGALVRRWVHGNRVSVAEASAALASIVETANPSRDHKSRTAQSLAEAIRALAMASADVNATAPSSTSADDSGEGEVQGSGVTLLMRVRGANLRAAVGMPLQGGGSAVRHA
jgi:hypothetical protein